MKVKIFESFSRIELEKELMEFSKYNTIVQISLSTTKRDDKNCYSLAVGYEFNYYR